MAAVDQARIGLLVPGWVRGRGRSLRSTPVVDDVPEAGPFAGLTIDQVAAHAGVRKEVAREALFEGRLPAPRARGRQLPPQLRAWIDEHFGPGLSLRDVAKQQRMTRQRIRALAAAGQPPPPPGTEPEKRAKKPKPKKERRPQDMDQVLRRMLATPPEPKKASPKKPRRRRQPAAFILKWAMKFLSAEMHGWPLHRVAAHFHVTAPAVRHWARRGVPPKQGGYRPGELVIPVSGGPRGKAKARSEQARQSKPAPPMTRPAMTAALRERLRSAFLAELRARAPVASRLARIFQAEIRI